MDDEFTRLVERCASKLENHEIFNASKDHALILFKKLFDVAERRNESVKIFSGCFEADFYDKLIEPIKRVLGKGISVQLISECPGQDLENNLFVQTVKSSPTGDVKTLSPETEKYRHFILIDNCRYRYENDNGTKSARANFNDPMTGALIDKQFERMWSRVA